MTDRLGVARRAPLLPAAVSGGSAGEGEGCPLSPQSGLRADKWSTHLCAGSLCKVMWSYTKVGIRRLMSPVPPPLLPSPCPGTQSCLTWKGRNAGKLRIHCSPSPVFPPGQALLELPWRHPSAGCKGFPSLPYTGRTSLPPKLCPTGSGPKSVAMTTLSDGALLSQSC